MGNHRLSRGADYPTIDAAAAKAAPSFKEP